MRTCPTFVFLLLAFWLAAASDALAQTVGDGVCYANPPTTTTDCSGPPLLLSLSPFRLGDSLVASGTNLVQDAQSGASQTYFPLGITAGVSTSVCNTSACVAYALQLNGGPGFVGTNSELDLLFGFNPIGFNPSYSFKYGTLTINTAGTGLSTQPPSVVALARTDASLTGPIEVGEVDFTGKDSTQTLQNWGTFRCDAVSTTGGSGDAGRCRASINSGGAPTEQFDFNATNTAALTPAFFNSTASFTGAATFAGVTTFNKPISFGPKAIASESILPPVAGGGEVGYYTPLDAPTTNLIVSNTAPCTTPWTCTNLSAHGISPAPTSPDGSQDLQEITSNATGPASTVQNFTNLTASTNYVLSIYWENTNRTTYWQAVLNYTGGSQASFSCTYTPTSGTQAVTTGTFCTVSSVGHSNYRMVITGYNPGSSTASVTIYANGNAQNAPTGDAFMYCPQLEQPPAGSQPQNPVATRCLLTGGKTLSRPPGGNPLYTVLQESSGNSETLAASSTTDIITSSGSLTTLTLNLPARPITGQRKRIVCDVAVATNGLSVKASGSVVAGAPTSCGAGTSFSVLPVATYNSATWYRVQ